VSQENYYPEINEELSHVRKLIGATISPAAANYLMILKSSDINLLHSLSTSGATELETLLTAKSMSSGNVKFYQEMKHLMENVNGTTAISEPLSF